VSLLVGAISIGLVLTFLALGIFISLRVFKFADITAEGSFALGGASAAILLVTGVNPFLATFVAVLSGFLAGMTTGLLNTRLKVHELLSGILVMTALYSINLRIMGKSNVSLLNAETLFTPLQRLVDKMYGPEAYAIILGWKVSSFDLAACLGVFLVAVVIAWLLNLFFRTHIGTAMRATGDNPQMIRALGQDTNTMLIFGLGLSNALIALSGALLAQFQGFADVQMGIGMMVWGIASLIIGEALIGIRSTAMSIVAAVSGSIVFRLLVSIALRWGLNPNDLKLITAVFVLLALALPGFLDKIKRTEGRPSA